MPFRNRSVTMIIALVFTTLFSVAGAGEKTSLRKIQETLAAKTYVDLTHEFESGIPHWPGFPDEGRKTIYWYDKRPDTMGSGFFSEVFTHVGQWGTHVDPPAHFIKGLRTVDQIGLKEMVLRLVVVDVHDDVAKNPDYTLSIERLKKWERDHGEIPAGAFVAMRTDWSKRWPDAAKMENKDASGVAHYPGWSLPALKYLYEERKITVRSRNYGYRSWNRHNKERLLARNLPPEHKSLSNRVAHQSRSSPRIRRHRRGQFSKTKGRFGFPGARFRDRSLNLTRRSRDANRIFRGFN